MKERAVWLVKSSRKIIKDTERDKERKGYLKEKEKDVCLDQSFRKIMRDRQRKTERNETFEILWKRQLERERVSRKEKTKCYYGFLSKT